jgi:hypothetical protein
MAGWRQVVELASIRAPDCGFGESVVTITVNRRSQMTAGALFRPPPSLGYPRAPLHKAYPKV